MGKDLVEFDTGDIFILVFPRLCHASKQPSVLLVNRSMILTYTFFSTWTLGKEISRSVKSAQMLSYRWLCS